MTCWMMSAWTCFLALLAGGVGVKMASAVESSEVCGSLSEVPTQGAALLQTERNVGRTILSADDEASDGHSCCLSSKDSNDECGTCRPGNWANSNDWCAASEANCMTGCSGAWCTGSSDTAQPTLEPVVDVIVSAGCCLSAEDVGDQCGTCRPGNWANSNDWCAASEANCMTGCSGAWCTGSSAPVSTPEPASERPTVQPTPQPASEPVVDPVPEPTPATASTRTPTPTTTVAPTPAPSGANNWVQGTWTTGYWDCCKPSCSWPNKGSVSQPIQSCDASTGEKLTDANVPSVCDGGSSASCADNKPIVVAPRLSMGFAAIAVSGNHGLTGDANCGQCFELKFTDTIHSSGNWGGSHPDLVGMSMVVQVSNIGYDVSGDHSFDLQIPGAGQGIFTKGCTAQFPGTTSGDFDCDNNYGGCDERSGCARLPQELRAGCEWRYDWYHWLAAGGQTNNPFVDFRRVRCPEHLTNISGSLSDDDSSHPEIDLSSYA